MKVLINFLTVLVLSSLLISCNSSGTSGKNAANDTVSAKTNEPAPAVAAANQPESPAQVQNQQKAANIQKNKLLSKYSPMTKAPVPFKNAENDPTIKEAEALYSSASEKAQKGDHQTAIEEYTKSLSLYKTAVCYMKRGYSYIMMKNYQASLEDLNAAIKINPTLDEAFFARGICRFEMQDFKGSEEDFNRYLKKDQKNPLAYNYMAGIRFMQKDTKGALEYYEKVANLDPDFPDIYTNRGMMRHYQNDLEGAIADYNEAIKRNPSNATAYNNRGAAKLNKHDYEGAKADFDLAIKLRPEYADAFDNRAKCLYNLGDQASACDDWQKAYSLGLQASMQMIEKYCK